jgi:predicted pyridoxine 5'-phosphate oxidase superfamily flavin-nucleotide-binding protein
MDGAFHEGELRLQALAGVQEKLHEAGARFIRDHMPAQHREFFALLPFLVLGGLDEAGWPWASLLAGPPGFATSPDERHLRIAARPIAGDPLAGSLRPGRPVGLLGIEPHTRRRNRMNGRVVQEDGAGFTVRVQQSFGNCPRYIQARQPLYTPRAGPSTTTRNACLDARAQALVRQADTFFIATAHPQALREGSTSQGADVSHRGGKPGFVHVQDDTHLLVPDFSGNSYFNTLGNLLLEPRCGLLFIDFGTGDLLQLSGEGQVIAEGEALASFAGARRLLAVQVRHAVFTPGAAALQWGPAELSREVLTTGAWPDAPRA